MKNRFRSIPWNMFLFLFVLLCVQFILSADRAIGRDGMLLGGTAKLDITPEDPVHLSGYASRKDLSQGIHDSLSARIVVFEKNGSRLVLVSSDIIGYYGQTAQMMRNAILQEFELKPAELFLSAIHTHSGPSLSVDEEKAHPNNVKYTQNLKGKLIKGIRSAFEDLHPVEIGCGSGSSPVGANRREIMIDKNGNSRVWLGRNPDGPTDDEVQVVKMVDNSGELNAVLFDYATHSTCLGPQNYIISGDVHGLAEQFIEKYLSGGVIAPAFAGASGDIDPWYRILPGFETKNGWIPEPVLLGTMLGEEVVHVLNRIENTSADGDIGCEIVTIDLPGKPEGEMEIPEGFATTPLTITTARIGDVGIVGLGGEVLSDIGKAIKAASPFKHTLVITHCNGSAGYLPPKNLYVAGGYEIRTSPFAPQAAEIVIKKAVEMLYRL